MWCVAEMGAAEMTLTLISAATKITLDFTDLDFIMCAGQFQKVLRFFQFQPHQPLLCPECGIAFKAPSLLNRHLRGKPNL